MYINIRDDDTNFFTQPSELEEAYGHYLSEIPITLACTPFVSKHSFIMDSLSGNRKEQFLALKEIENLMDANELADINRVYPIGDNKELTNFLYPLVTDGSVEITLHGYSHRFYDDGAEFIKNHINFYNVRDGKLYLESLFNTKLMFFVPPSNKIDKDALQFLKKTDLSLLTSGVVDTNFYLEKLALYGNLALHQPRSIFGMLKGKLSLNPCRLSGVRVYRSKTFQLSDTPESFFERNKEIIKNDGFISIATHYTSLSRDKSYKENFFNTIEFLKEKYKNCKFVSAKELGEIFF